MLRILSAVALALCLTSCATYPETSDYSYPDEPVVYTSPNTQGVNNVVQGRSSDSSSGSYGGGGCTSGNYYGSTSCITGLPRTTYVHGYTTKAGTYVAPYYRSSRR